MIYKPEAVVDLDTGAIVRAEIVPGIRLITRRSTRILEAQTDINPASGANWTR